MEEMDFQKDVSINKYKLDEECLSHASLYALYASAQADAKNEVTRAKDNLELVEAEQNLAIRQEYQESGQKVTEATINSRLINDTKVIRAKRKLRDAEEVFAKLSVSVQAFEHRRSELDNLVKLYCAGYYSVPNSNSEIKKNMNEETSNDIRRSLNKR